MSKTLLINTPLTTHRASTLVPPLCSDARDPLNRHGETFLESSQLPLAIKEKGVEYQFHRAIIFSRLLESYPFSTELILSEAVIDICPLLRGEIWAAILRIKVRRW